MLGIRKRAKIFDHGAGLGSRVSMCDGGGGFGERSALLLELTYCLLLLESWDLRGRRGGGWRSRAERALVIVELSVLMTLDLFHCQCASRRELDWF